MAKYKVLYWYDIPTQVRSEDENGRASLQLSDRFQLAIDEVAMAAKLISTDDYTDGFIWHPAQEKEGSAKDVAAFVVAEIEAEFSEIDIESLVEKLRKMKKAK
ncbi:MAG TPA: virulence factor [Anaerolineales bacterium]